MVILYSFFTVLTHSGGTKLLCNKAKVTVLTKTQEKIQNNLDIDDKIWKQVPTFN